MKITIQTFLVTFYCCLWEVLGLPDFIKIGGIFDATDERLELAFRYAIDIVNNKPDILKRSTLLGEVKKLPENDSFHASKQVCELLEQGMAAIFGPQSENTANHVQSICDAKEIPHIETRWDYKQNRDKYSFNLYPYPPSLSRAYRDVLMELKWKKFVILYDSNEGLVRLQSLLMEKEFDPNVRMLMGDDGDYRPLLKELKKSQATHIVLDVEFDKIHNVLKQAQQIGLMNEYINYFVTHLDFNLIDITDFKFRGTNITGIQMIDQRKTEIKEIAEIWARGERNKYGRELPPHLRHVTTEAALMFDAVHLFAQALDDLDIANQVTMEKLYCDGDQTWSHGDSIINLMKMAKIHSQMTPVRPPLNPMRGMSSYGRSRLDSINPIGGVSSSHYGLMNQPSVQVFGLTGILKFDSVSGFREDFQLDLLEVDVDDDMKVVGTWTHAGGVNYTRSWAEVEQEMQRNLLNKTLYVSTALTPPYSMLKEEPESLHGNDRFEGFCIDLIHEISLLRGFNYTFVVVPDGSYGSYNEETGKWNGIIKELMDHRAHLGIVDFTITYEREEAVDFSMPFMNLGISIVYKKPQKKAPSLFSFMSPFSVDVWIYMATAYLGVSVLLFILARMVPDEWDSPYPCIQEPEELENSFTLNNCLWFNIATFLCQGGDIAPRAVSTRIVAGIWWFFTLIMISSYTANLAAFLTVERMDSPIEGAEDLAKQTKIKYGCKEFGSTYNFFKNSKIPTYQRMWASMSNAKPTVFTGSNADGIERVQKSDGMYAFLMESVSIEYEVERKCDLMQIGGLLDSKSYGIALPHGSPYTGPISSAILKLKEDGILHKLKTRWWKQRKGGGRCTVDEEDGGASAAELGVDNVGGVFVVMVGGCILAFFTACCEFLWKARKLATEAGDTFTEELRKELLFIVKCNEAEKPVRKKASAAETDSSSFYDESSSTYGYSEKKPVK